MMTDIHPQACVILVTTGSEAEAETIAAALLEEHLVACVTLLNPVRSLYRWQGKIADDRECVLVIKTRTERFAAVEAKVQALHSYEVPEIICLPIMTGSSAYLSWLNQETTPKDRTA